MRTPFLVPAYRSRSKNSSDALLINLFIEIIETKQGKDVGALYLCPGLTLFEELTGAAGCRPGGLHVMNGVLYAVVGATVYSITTAMVVTNLGNIGTTTGVVSIIDNGLQLAIFDGTAGWLLPGGYPLTGGVIGAGGAQYDVGDFIYLAQAGGKQNQTAILEVSTIAAGGVVTGFTIFQAGAFNPQATGFTQASTSGSGSGFILNTPTYGAFSNIFKANLPFSNPGSATYLDGFGLVGQLNTNTFWQSNLLDLSVWQPLNFSEADASPDNIQSLKAIHEEIWIIKERHTEIWVDAGIAGFAFQRLQGVYIEVGTNAPASVVKAGETLFWISQNGQGENVILQSNGYRPQRVSTHAIEYAIGQYATTTDAVTYCYEQEGHVFIVFTFPTGNETWVYDVTASELAGIPIWHQRAAFASGTFSRHWGICYTLFNNMPIVGDYRNGNLYIFDLNNPLDNGTARKWVRSWRALPKPSEEPVAFKSLRIDMQTGGPLTPQNTTPLLVLQWSDDDGYTWSNEYFRSAGQIGQTALRVKYNRLGSTRRNSGLDRIFKISSTDVFNVALIGAELEGG